MPKQAAQIYLASSSPRRQELLAQIGVRFRVVPVQCAEHAAGGEPPMDYVRRLAMEKARAGQRAVQGDVPLPVLGADTVVEIEGRMLGKPESREQAMDMLRCLSGRTHNVFTAVAVVAEREMLCLSASRVTFRSLSAAEADAYCDSLEGMDKAGAYAVQGRAAIFIQRIEGSYSGIMGLPLFETAELLSASGVTLW